jgi:hypothetical protein
LTILSVFSTSPSQSESKDEPNCYKETIPKFSFNKSNARVELTEKQITFLEQAAPIAEEISEDYKIPFEIIM